MIHDVPLPDMQAPDESVGDPDTGAAQSAKKTRVRLRPQVQYVGVRKPRPNWPFLYYEEGGKQYLNIAPRKSRKDEVKEMEEALW